MNYYLLIPFILLNLLIVAGFRIYGNFFNITDKPDGVRKTHSNEVKIFGGIIILINLALLCILGISNLDEIIFDQLFFDDYRAFFSFFIFSFLFFIIGFYDDVYKLSANKKLSLCTIFFIGALSLNPDLNIDNFYLEIIDFHVELEIFSYYFSVLCFLLLLNAINMFDGINLQVGLFSITIFLIFFLVGIFEFISLVLIISLVGYLYLNYKNKIFLGDGGIYLISFLITFILIEQNNHDKAQISPELILQILIIPGIDMLRLFILRLMKNQNPFYPDRQHLHHLIMKHHNVYLTNLIIQSLIIFPILIGTYYSDFRLSLSISVLAYFILLLLNFYIDRKSNI